MKPDVSPIWTGYHVFPPLVTAGPVTSTLVPSVTLVTIFPVLISGLSRTLTLSPSVFATVNFRVDGTGADVAGELVGVDGAVCGVDVGVGVAGAGESGRDCAEYEYAPGRLKTMPPVTIWMSAAPAACGGVMAVIVALSTTRTFVAGRPPTETVAPGWKFAPVNVTVVPPDSVPLVGFVPVMCGRLVSTASENANASKVPTPVARS